MKHSELMALENKPSFAHGIEIDDLPDFIARDLNEIGILANLNSDSLDYDVLDACIAYISNGVNVVLEVPFETNFDPEGLVLEAMATEFDISILPPYVSPDDKDAWSIYEERLIDFTKAWLSQPNNKQMVYPVSGFLGYMIGEVFEFKPKEISTDLYIKSVFVDNIPINIMDKIKEKIRIVIYEHFDGKEKFEEYAHTLANGIANYYSNVN